MCCVERSTYSPFSNITSLLCLSACFDCHCCALSKHSLASFSTACTQLSNRVTAGMFYLRTFPNYPILGAVPYQWPLPSRRHSDCHSLLMASEFPHQELRDSLGGDHSSDRTGSLGLNYFSSCSLQTRPWLSVRPMCPDRTWCNYASNPPESNS